MTLQKVISGGQTGVDEAALRAAKRLGIQTGGHMPLGFRTQAGQRHDFRELYGLIEHYSPAYPPRTSKNVSNSDGTLIMGDPNSPGCKLTARLCHEMRRPMLAVSKYQKDCIASIRMWLAEQSLSVLNVAGNREETNPGIGAWAEAVLVEALVPASPSQDRRE